MRIRLVLALLALTSLAACVSRPLPPPRAAERVHGQVTGLDDPQHARVEVFRVADSGIVERLHDSAVMPASDGSFRTGALVPGRYLLALRAPGRPVSVVSLPVPPAPSVQLVARDPVGTASLEIRQDLPGVATLPVLLCRVEPGVPVTDRRTVDVRAGASALVRGLSAGRWQLDVVGTGATTEIEVPDRADRLTLRIDPAEVGTGAVMIGRVFREDGRPARGVAVTVRAFPEGADQPASWGRSAITDSDGGYRLQGLPVGRALLRLECRDAVHRRLPEPTKITIPPSGVLRRSFVVGP